ncbi:hypothetical protein AXF42_Ash017038 [Apostasia shenzhenica]|uniref:DUF4218 domain-containing protein n=1 Tax=Apostasia shenzhenica TaxID=1088818 RepID=A0A2I0B7I5_9ASPA|nr:hypothetical protein AXF42_Ash017038 [Apostasia shenzhenica]
MLDGESSKISCVNVKDGKISGMKSHDCHVFLQDYLSVVFRNILSKEVYEPLVELCVIFKQLTSKTLSSNRMNKLENDIAITLYKLEQIFPPTFF